MDALHILSYGGVLLLVTLLIVFEIKYRQGGTFTQNEGYLYYTCNHVAVRIRHIAGTRYRVYVQGDAPVPTQEDRYGSYFKLNAHSASDAEYQIDALYATQR